MATHAPRWSELTAVFGGAFDPPHVGHEEVVRGLFVNPGAKRVVVVPSACPPHKPCVAKTEDRVAMTKLCFADSNVVIDLFEIEKMQQCKSSNQKTYSYDSIEYLRNKFGPLAFVIGTDQLEKIETWYRFPEVLNLCHWIVLARKPDGFEIAQKKLAFLESNGIVQKRSDSEVNIWHIQRGTFMTIRQTDAREISSTQIRESLVRSGEASEGCVNPRVLRYLMEHKLYGSRGVDL